MNYHSESNERRTRQNALWLTIALYVGLGAFIYLATDAKPAAKTELTQAATKVSTPKAAPIVRP
ncbi:MAG: hypothetical protein ABIO24_09275 [Saprospiraceae bacterium]